MTTHTIRVKLIENTNINDNIKTYYTDMKLNTDSIYKEGEITRKKKINIKTLHQTFITCFVWNTLLSDFVISTEKDEFSNEWRKFRYHRYFCVTPIFMDEEG